MSRFHAVKRDGTGFIRAAALVWAATLAPEGVAAIAERSTMAVTYWCIVAVSVAFVADAVARRRQHSDERAMD